MPGHQRLHVEWSDAAKQDVIMIGDYIARRNPINAISVLDRLEDRANSLSTLPNRGRPVPELVKFGFREFLELQEPPWRIVYQIKADIVEILAVIDGRRKASELLLERVSLE